jgi:hypothetical protein
MLHCFENRGGRRQYPCIACINVLSPGYGPNDFFATPHPALSSFSDFSEILENQSEGADRKRRARKKNREAVSPPGFPGPLLAFPSSKT